MWCLSALAKYFQYGTPTYLWVGAGQCLPAARVGLGLGHLESKALFSRLGPSVSWPSLMLWLGNVHRGPQSCSSYLGLRAAVVT